jgi:hypothetical protein
MYVYDTVTAAVNGLKSRGYTTDFNLAENCLVCQGNKLRVSDFEIVEVYRFEGNTDPADEAAVYAIEGKDGSKGVLVSAYGVYSEDMEEEMIKKLSIR